MIVDARGPVLPLSHRGADKPCGRGWGNRDGGRIIAGSYAPLAATLKLSATLLTLLESVTTPTYSPGQLATLLRSYTTGFVIDEQAYLELKASDEWDELVEQIADNGHQRPADADDLIAILTGDRDGSTIQHRPRHDPHRTGSVHPHTIAMSMRVNSIPPHSRSGAVARGLVGTVGDHVVDRQYCRRHASGEGWGPGKLIVC